MVRPVLVHPTGFRMSPYADIKPAGDDAATAARRAASGAAPQALALQPRQLRPLIADGQASLKAAYGTPDSRQEWHRAVPNSSS